MNSVFRSSKPLQILPAVVMKQEVQAAAVSEDEED
jgi:hypothetical protein